MSQYTRSVAASPLPSDDDSSLLNLQIYVPELQLQKCLTVSLEEMVWDIKRKLFAALPQPLPQSFNFGLFLPPCDGRAGKFLLEDRPIRDYPFHDCVPYVELKYKKKVYKMLNLDEKSLKQMHSKNNLKKFIDYVGSRNAEKVEKWCANGLDPNFHDANGETPLTLAAGIPRNREVLIALIGGGAHLDFRNTEGQTGMHKAAFLSMAENVKTLLELGASPNYRDLIGLTPLYYCMLTPDSNDAVAQMLLNEAAEIGVTDMHGNHELHQACKNGLVKHVENLLYYGAEINAQNVNGNTALQVCAVNSRADCARVLLFRGADPMIMNKQGQTALHIAHLVGAHDVANNIQSHNPQHCVPYRGTPKYSTRRRIGSQIIRRRSLSQSSMCSAISERFYQSPQSTRGMPSPTPSRISMNRSEYGTLRRYPANSFTSNGIEKNIPRILVIPRGPKGFGFILRGAKNVDAELDFHPRIDLPALQFFEGVDMSGMAMKAGLRPGDFLLEINGIDVRMASHEEVVRLIHESIETITLKVITVESDTASNQYAASIGGTLPSRRSVRPNGALPPMPPQRNPSTALSSFGHLSFSGESPDYESASEIRHSAKSMECLAEENTYGEQQRCASVKHRPAARRISAAELEHLMVRQGTSQFQPIPYESDNYGTPTGPKKFTSVADMKRRKQRNIPPSPGLPRAPDNQTYQSLKSFNSSPDLPNYEEFQRTPSIVSTNDDYSRPFRVLRPKTPPPPPPPTDICDYRPSTSASIPPAPPPPPSVLPPIRPPTNGPPAPPPLSSQIPSSDFSTDQKADCRGISAEALTNVRLKPVNNNTLPSPPVASIPPQPSSSKKPDFDSDLRSALAKRRSKIFSTEQPNEEETTKNDNGGGNEYGGLSLRESVQTLPKSTKQHSPPGFVNKKDSGYASSRTSLEPSECGEEQTTAPSPLVPHDDAKVTIISQQLEDSLIVENETFASTLPSLRFNCPAPLDIPFNENRSIVYRNKELAIWTMDDVADWLTELKMIEYVDVFRAHGIVGNDLQQFDRIRFTQLGITRIAHRQIMEKSLGELSAEHR